MNRCQINLDEIRNDQTPMNKVMYVGNCKRIIRLTENSYNVRVPTNNRPYIERGLNKEMAIFWLKNTDEALNDTFKIECLER